ncbi:MAG: hypothetical protein RR214_06270, partial [Synergistaceae bacterium]
LFAIFRDLWVYSLWGEKGLEALELSDSGREFLKKEAVLWSAEQLRSVCVFCNELLPRTRYGMRIEVFSGLIMLEITNIISGADLRQQVRQKPIQPPVMHVIQNKEPVPQHTDAPQTTEIRNAAHAVPSVSVQHTPKPDNTGVLDAVKAAMPLVPSIKFNSSAICSELGETDFSKLIDKLESKKLLIASALLHARLMRTETGWDVSVPSESLAELILTKPQNRQILSSAVRDVWNISNEDDAKAEEQMQEAPRETVVQVKEPVPADAASQVKANDRVSSPMNDDIGRVLKLMGADILYVHDANFSGEDEEGCEHNGQ